MMTSTVESVINAQEMDSWPDPLRTDNTRIAGTANFSNIIQMLK